MALTSSKRSHRSNWSSRFCHNNSALLENWVFPSGVHVFIHHAITNAAANYCLDGFPLPGFMALCLYPLYSGRLKKSSK